MDVRCGRCGTEYEFDNALVSERGTTVRCTNCGHQFKVFPEKPASSKSREEWIVRKRGGAQVTYRSLKGLQKAIADGHIEPQDTFSRDGSQFRPLENVAELASFFRAKSSPKAAGTLLGIQPAPPPKPGSSSAPAPPAPPQDEAREPEPREPVSVDPDSMDLDSKPLQAVPQIPIEPPPPQPRISEPPPALHADEDPSIDTQRSSSIPPPIPKKVRRHQSRDSVPAKPSAPPRGTHRSERRSASTVPSVRARDESEFPSSDARFSHVEQGARGARSRWIVGFVLVCGVGLAAATVGRTYLEQFRSKPPAADPAEGRAAQLVADGVDKFYGGDLEGAKAQFDKGTVLSPGDAAAFVWLARVEATRAGRHWLLGRLLGDGEEQAAQRDANAQRLTERLGKLDAALAAAAAVSADDPELGGVKVDAARLKGDVSGARGGVAAMKQGSAESGYVLAMLDVADDAGAYETAIERLRVAISQERGLTRSRAALVYVLLRAKKNGEALSELVKLHGDEEMASALRAFATAQGVELEASGAGGAPPVTSQSAPASPTEGEAPASAETLNRRARAARNSGDLALAEKLYNDSLKQEPGNVETLTGLGEVAMSRGEPNVAADYFDRVLRLNPGYSPAMIARADLRWSSGDRPGALKLYRDVLSQVGESHPYGVRAQAKIDQAAASAPAATSTASSPATQPSALAPAAPAPTATPTASPTPTPTAAPKQEESSHPDIDLSDLPGFQK